MVLANNGILIVALTMALGLHINDRWLMAAAFAMAGLSYLANIADEWDAANASNALKWITIIIGAGAYLLAAARLFGG